MPRTKLSPPTDSPSPPGRRTSIQPEPEPVSARRSMSKSRTTSTRTQVRTPTRSGHPDLGTLSERRLRGREGMDTAQADKLATLLADLSHLGEKAGVETMIKPILSAILPKLVMIPIYTKYYGQVKNKGILIDRILCYLIKELIIEKFNGSQTEEEQRRILAEVYNNIMKPSITLDKGLKRKKSKKRRKRSRKNIKKSRKKTRKKTRRK